MGSGLKILAHDNGITCFAADMAGIEQFEMQGICQKIRTDRIFYIVFNFSKLNLTLRFFTRPKVEIARHQNRIVATSTIAI